MIRPLGLRFTPSLSYFLRSSILVIQCSHTVPVASLHFACASLLSATGTALHTSLFCEPACRYVLGLVFFYFVPLTLYYFSKESPKQSHRPTFYYHKTVVLARTPFADGFAFCHSHLLRCAPQLHPTPSSRLFFCVYTLSLIFANVQSHNKINT